MLEMLYECESAYGLPEGGIPESQLRAVFGDAQTDAALWQGLIGRYRGCARTRPPGSRRTIVALTETGRARVAAEVQAAIRKGVSAGDVAVATLFGARP